MHVRRETTAGLVASVIVHWSLLLGLALLTLAVPRPVRPPNLVAVLSEEAAESLDDLGPKLQSSPSDPNSLAMISSAPATTPSHLEANDLTTVDLQPAAPANIQLSDAGLPVLLPTELLNAVSAQNGAGLHGRGAAARGALVAEGGGSAASEASVSRALVWLSKHQRHDGSWAFDFKDEPCGGQCTHGGLLELSTSAATGLALLPFLGAGQTHIEGDFQPTVEQGLAYLRYHMQVDRKKKYGVLADTAAGMYEHAIATIALCEAYALTHDSDLRDTATLAVNFIVHAQDPQGGGWRYAPQRPGDTSATGWQIMALKSAHMAYLPVPEETVRKAGHFLDSVASEGGALYGYLRRENGIRPANTATGLLCRMYMGWPRENEGLALGVRKLAELGPSRTNMYYNYYATQVMRHYEGPMWQEWNAKMRDYLVDTQAREGHEEGSWFFEQPGPPDNDHGAEVAGRLYFTTLATLVLEVYYRFLPLYREEMSTGRF